MSDVRIKLGGPGKREVVIDGHDLNGMEHGHERPPRHPVFLNGIDLSGYVANTEMDHDGEDKKHWHETIPGLKDASMSITGAWDMDLATFTDVFASHNPERPIIVQQPDGRWNAIKARLARRWPLRWLKVRWRVYTTRGVPHLDPQTGKITVSTTAPVTVATVTRRGRP